MSVLSETAAFSDAQYQSSRDMQVEKPQWNMNTHGASQPIAETKREVRNKVNGVFSILAEELESM